MLHTPLPSLFLHSKINLKNISKIYPVDNYSKPVDNFIKPCLLPVDNYDMMDI
jgi:hypothetical protein